jgi:hypothetical protein
MAERYARDALARTVATGLFMLAIAGVGAVMMGVTSSPAVKGAALLWLPAALQLMAGVWLGPTRGFLAAGLGAQAAGIIAYGGWAPSDWIMNFVAGGFANAWLPAVLFRFAKIDPQLLGSTDHGKLRLPAIGLLTVAAIAFAFLQRPIFAAVGLPSLGAAGFILPLGVVLLVPPLLGVKPTRDFVLAFAIVVLICGVSAALGVAGSMVGGQTLEAAVLTVGIGWFLGDTVSAVVGLYALATLTPWARERGIAPLPAGAAKA